MKKLLVIALLVVGTAGFANSGKVLKHKKIKKITLSCCTVGEFTSCGPDGPLNCHTALVTYCQHHTCSPRTLAAIADFR